MPVRPCLDCGALSNGTRCPPCTKLNKPSAHKRGYDGAHRAARTRLAATLPAPCGYGCGRILEPDSDWVAAHVIDGDPGAGWLASCRSCNEQAKHR